MQKLFLPEFRYVKGSTTPEDSTSNLPVESTSKRIKKNSNLLSFSSFFDEDSNVICVGGRLTSSPHSVDKKFPIVIPKTFPLAELLIRESHLRKFQSGPQMTLFALRQTVWIPGGIASVKKVIHNCKPCIRFDASIRQPLMGDLPAERIVESLNLLPSNSLGWTNADRFIPRILHRNCKNHTQLYSFVSPQRRYT